MLVDEERLHPLLEAVLRPRIGHAPRPWPQPLRRAIERLCAARDVSPETLLRRLAAQPEAATIASLVVGATVTHTTLFRHRAQLERLREELVRLARPVRIWSAGCASGEEPYTLAMIAREVGVMASVLATDVNPEALEIARAGRYPAAAARRAGLPVEGDVWTVPLEVRAMVRFERASLTEPSGSEPAFDFVFCRNVLIYFDASAGLRVIARLVAALRPGGALVIAPVEALRPLPEGLSRVDPLGWLVPSPPAPARVPTPAPAPRAEDVELRPVEESLAHAARALGLGALDEAERALHAVLAADSTRAEAWFLLGEVLEQRGETTQARTAFGNAARHAASDAEGQTLANAARRRARPD